MIKTAQVALRADRWTPFAYVLRFDGVDLTGAILHAQVRLSPDSAGLLLDLPPVTDPSAQGVRLMSVTAVDSVPSSYVRLQIPGESLGSAIPYPGEQGEAFVLAWDLLVTLPGRTRARWLGGPFTIVPGATQLAAAALADDPPPGSAEAVYAVDVEALTVTISGADALGPMVDDVTISRDAAAASDASAAGHAMSASLSAATALTASALYPDTATGLAAIAEGAYFTVAGDGTSTYAILYRKVGGAAVEQARYASKAAYEGEDGAGLVGWRGSVPGAIATKVKIKLGELAISPADMGGLHAAINATNAAPEQRAVAMPEGVGYDVTAGITIDTLRSSLRGSVTLSAGAAMADGHAAITTECTTASPLGNSYGYKGRQEDFRLVGPGQVGRGLTGLRMASSHDAASSQALFANVSIARWDVGVSFEDRGYNSLFLKSEVFSCTTCIDWPAGHTDAGERNSFVSCTLYGADLAFQIDEQFAALYFTSGSIDYTAAVAKVTNGAKLYITDSHTESNRWASTPFSVDGQGGCLVLSGGHLINSAYPKMGATEMGTIGAGAEMRIEGLGVDNIALTRIADDEPTCWFDGAGYGHVRDITTYEYGAIPERLHRQYTSLGDPDCEDAALATDLVYVSQDVQALGDPLTGRNCVLASTTDHPRTGSRCYVASKLFGQTSASAFALNHQQVRFGDKVLSGVRLRLHPDFAGVGTNTVYVTSYFGLAHRFDTDGRPIFTRTSYFGSFAVPVPTDRYVLVSPFNGISQFIVPEWANWHFLEISLAALGGDGTTPAKLLIDGRWADRW